MCLSVQQGLRAGNVPGNVWCPSMVWPWHPVGIVGEGKGHLAPGEPAWAGGQPGDPQGSPDTLPRSLHMRVHTHTHTPRYTHRAWLCLCTQGRQPAVTVPGEERFLTPPQAELKGKSVSTNRSQIPSLLETSPPCNPPKYPWG